MSQEDGCTSCGKWWLLEDYWCSPPGTPPRLNPSSTNGILYVTANKIVVSSFSIETDC